MVERRAGLALAALLLGGWALAAAGCAGPRGSGSVVEQREAAPPPADEPAAATAEPSASPTLDDLAEDEEWRRRTARDLWDSEL